MKKEQVESKYDFDIDYEIFSTEEIIRIYQFYGDVIKYHRNKKNPEYLYNEYNEYRKVINSIAMEKRYDKNFEKKTGFSIYSVIKEIKERLNK